MFFLRHLQKLAEDEHTGLQEFGTKDEACKSVALLEIANAHQCVVHWVAETLPADILVEMNVRLKCDHSAAEAAVLEQNHAFLFGIPTRLENFPSQWKKFWDATSQWSSGQHWGKYAGLFIGIASQDRGIRGG